MLDLKFIGIGGATCIDLGENSAYLKQGKSLLVIDLSGDVTKKLNDLKVFDGVNDVTVVLTHLHSDHVAGLGVFLWYLNFVKKIKPNFIINSEEFNEELLMLMKLQGINPSLVNFIDQAEFNMNSLKLKMLPTNHAKNLKCFGIMFSDNDGQYYYSGDTRDFDRIRDFYYSDEVKKIYLEVARETYGVHIAYNDIKSLDIKNKNKLILMHISDVMLYNQIKDEGYNVAKIENPYHAVENGK